MEPYRVGMKMPPRRSRELPIPKGEQKAPHGLKYSVNKGGEHTFSEEGSSERSHVVIIVPCRIGLLALI